jgi:hypothetical protein
LRKKSRPEGEKRDEGDHLGESRSSNSSKGRSRNSAGP